MKRIIFWIGFIVVLALIVWGLVVAMNKPTPGSNLGAPAAITAEDHSRGPENAKVTIIEYSDFQCPACKTYYPIVERLNNESSTTVRFIYRHFPLFPIPHKNAIVAAQASEAAAKQGKFWEMYNILFENQLAWAESSTAPSIFEGYAGRLGLDMVAYKKDFDDPETKARIDRDKNDGIKIGVNSTPTFFINGKVIVNPQGYEAFKALIDEALSGSSN